MMDWEKSQVSPSTTCNHKRSKVELVCWSCELEKSRLSGPGHHDQAEELNVFRVEEHIVEGDDEPVHTRHHKLPAVFRWTGEGSDVYVSGSFNNWRTKIPLVKSESDFYTVVDIPEGTHQYKYFVDGEWVCHPTEPKIENGVGTRNNIITIRCEDSDIYQVLKSDGLDSRTVEPSSSPPGEYSQYFPSRDVHTGFLRLGPPLLPPHLLETVLNKDVANHCEPMMVPEPNHVVLNHLYTLSIKTGVMVLSSTHRYRKKFITTLLYKPI